MAITSIPTSLGGVQLPFNQLKGPLASLFSPQEATNFLYPSDLATNPALAHAIQFSVYEYTTGFKDSVESGAAAIQQAAANPYQTIQNIQSGLKNFNSLDAAAGAVSSYGPAAAKFLQAGNYLPTKKTKPLANISLYMPDTLAVNYDSDYNKVEMTSALGLGGKIANAFSDMNLSQSMSKEEIANRLINSPYAKDLVANIGGAAASTLGAKGVTSDLLNQAMGQMVNPQIQLLYRGIDLRKFQFEFIFTPKDLKEAAATKNIIDAFVYYSLPGKVGGPSSSGQYLTPPQIFSIRMAFTGPKPGIFGGISSVFQSALNSIGLGFINSSNPTDTIAKDENKNSSLFTINDCVLTNVSVDYAPNGWAAYNDGSPVQTRLILSFQETQIITKPDYPNGRQ